MKKLFLALLLCLGAPFSASAASLYLSPASLSLSAGQVGTFSIYVESASQALNAVSATISVDSGVSLMSATKTGSIISFWGTEPSIGGGTLTLEGVVLNPGYTGSAGKVATFTVRANSAGTYSARFLSGSVLANDGQGTDITSGTRGGTITVTAAAAAPAPKKAEEEEQEESASSDTLRPSAFTITSATHPDQEGWYREETGTFSWDVPPGATATRLLLSENPNATPTIVYDSPIAQKTVNSLPDGTTHLLVQHYANGSWGGIGRYTINVDTTAPEAFEITFPHGSTGFNPQPIILFNTDDELSGIDHYDVKVGEGDVLASAAPTDSNPYTLPLLEPGAHTVAVTAFDKAGNVRTVTESLYIEGIDAPKITYYEEQIAYGDLLKIRGITYPNASVEVYARHNDKDEPMVMEPTKSNSLGDFSTVFTKRLKPGVYSVTARVIDARGARSPETEAVVVEVTGNPVIAFTLFLEEHWIVALVLLILIVGVLIGHFHIWHRLGRLVPVTSEAPEPEVNSEAERALALLKKDLRVHIRKIKSAGKSRVLSEEELTFLEQFEQDLSDTGTLVEREVKRRKKS